MAVCRRCGNQMADTAMACNACGELRYQAPQAPVAPTPPPAPKYAAPAPPPPQYPQATPQYPQQAYAAAQGAAAAAYAAVPVSADEAKGFIGALFDLSFSSFVTTKIIKFLYILSIAFSALYALVLVVGGFSRGVIPGAIALVLSPLFFLLTVVGARIWMEIVIVIFRGAEHLSEIAKNSKR